MKNQIMGSVYVIALLIFTICLDRWCLMNFSLTAQKPLLLCMGIALIVSCVSLYLNKKEERQPDKASRTLREKVILIVSNTCSGSLLDTLVVFSFIAFAAWIPDAVTDYVKEGNPNYLFRPIIYIAGLMLMIWGKPSVYVKRKKIGEDKRRILVTGMSNVTISTWNQTTNLIPVIKPFSKYKNIDTVVVLLSNSMHSGIQQLTDDKLDMLKEELKPLKGCLQAYRERIKKLSIKEDVLKYGTEETKGMETAITELVKSSVKDLYGHKGELKVMFSDPLDYNDFDVCNNACYGIVNHAMQGGGYKGRYEDSEVVVNTTPGTAVVSSVMTINAIKGDRAMLCVNQFTGAVDETNPNVKLIQFQDLDKD